MAKIGKVENVQANGKIKSGERKSASIGTHSVQAPNIHCVCATYTWQRK